ncbi:DUF4917 family protein [Yersinia pestis]|uniref:DUF4917 family protein n=1 Tax=Paenibacillus lautus TaxID=1401 RepID=UPI002564E298|nr:DUF4917 family protein [Paenibacillus lautus]MDL1163022.1 DUF4917 family protein [Yersinia pestis]MEC0257714.1 DUF4917 family protein [Paenibacillus lautus]
MLQKLSELDNPDDLLQNILIGNGFSIWFSQRFNYKTLLEKCEDLFEQDRQLFLELKTSNFETCLSVLNSASLVNKLYNLEADHAESYDRIKTSLINVVRKVHVERSSIPGYRFDQAESLFKKAKNIFTTNYDLLPYWIILSLKSELKDDQFGDAFSYDMNNPKRVSGLYFTEEFRTRRKMFYLHGNLSLFMEGGFIKKITNANNQNILSLVEKKINDGTPPLFVSEGTWELKKTSIESNQYLRFCFKKFARLQGNLTIFGQRLDEQSDNHIIDVIKKSKINKIAYAMYTADKLPEEVEHEKTRINLMFRGKEVLFFDASSLFEYTFDLAFGRL